MTGEERRARILDSIRLSSDPISGAALASMYQVSRQVIVQDIALLRAANHDIYSTPKGYLLISGQSGEAKPVVKSEAGVCTRVYKVKHADEQIEDELNSIVDMGGRVLDVYVIHDVYGYIKAELPINCRRQVKEFVKGIESGEAKPLKNLTVGGIHFHTVEADSEKILDLIEKELINKGYLITENEDEDIHNEAPSA